MTKGGMMSQVLSIRVSEKLAKKLENIARETERAKSFHIQKALETYLEQYADLQIALDRLHDTTDETISSEDMRKLIGL
jgi:RHH-type rel operon transcriptional repressor/antitoxin RelB